MEAVHLSYGVLARNPHISPDKPTTYKSWEIPASTSASMTVADIHHDEAIHPNSHSFIPERWRNSPKTEKVLLDRYFVDFGKGTRSCLGINHYFHLPLPKLDT
jgi:cytochrome P450